MSTLSSLLRDLGSLIFVAECIGCGKVMPGRVDTICPMCRGMIPLTNFHVESSNPMATKLQSFYPSIVNATAQYYYVNGGRWREIIHEMKYRHAWHTAYTLGYWYGCELAESALYQDIDVIVPVPIHYTRRLSRRYNQVEMIAEGVSKAMGVKVNRHSLYKQRQNPSQVSRQRHQRWENVEGTFALRKAEALEGKHILIVDDVFTTGSTVLSCVETIAASVKECRISVATIAVSSKELRGNIM